MRKLGNAEVGGQSGLFAFLAENADAHVGLLNHSHVVSSIPDGQRIDVVFHTHDFDYFGFLGGGTSANHHAGCLHGHSQEYVLAFCSPQHLLQHVSVQYQHVVVDVHFVFYQIIDEGVFNFTILDLVIGGENGEVLCDAFQVCGGSDALGGLNFVSSQHPNFDACLLEGGDGVAYQVLQLVFHPRQTTESAVQFQLLHLLFFFLGLSLVLLLSEFSVCFFRDVLVAKSQCPEASFGNFLTFVNQPLGLVFVDQFSTFRFRPFYHKHQLVSLHVAYHNAHLFGFTSEWNCSEDLPLYNHIIVALVFYHDFIEFSVEHVLSSFVSELHKSNFIGGTGLQFPFVLIFGRVYVVADAQHHNCILEQYVFAQCLLAVQVIRLQPLIQSMFQFYILFVDFIEFFFIVYYEWVLD